MDRLHRLAINDAHMFDDEAAGLDANELDPKAVALVRLAALVAVGGVAASYGAQADAAISAGASVGEIVEVLVAVVPVVGLPCVVTAAPTLALALGFDLEESADY